MGQVTAPLHLITKQVQKESDHLAKLSRPPTSGGTRKCTAERQG